MTAIVTKRYPLPAVAALIAGPSGRVLIVRTHKWSGLWGVPGGKVDYGETLESALKREMLEEVGLEIRDAVFAFTSELIEDPKFHKPNHFISLEYVAFADFENVIIGTPGGGGNSKLNGPQSALAFDLEGMDSHATVIPPAPKGGGPFYDARGHGTEVLP